MSIQITLEGLEGLVDLNGGTETRVSVYSVCLLQPAADHLYRKLTKCSLISTAGRKSCPLCPEEKFKACYSHKLRRHLQNLHWKVYVEFEGIKSLGSLWPL